MDKYLDNKNEIINNRSVANKTQVITVKQITPLKIRVEKKASTGFNSI